MNMYVYRVFHQWKQPKGFSITVPVINYYNLFQFLVPAEVEIDGQRIKTKPNACILSEPMQPRGFYFPEGAVLNWTHMKKSVLPLIQEFDIPVNCVLYPDNPEKLSALFQKIMREFNSDNLHREALTDTYTRELMIKLSRGIRSDRNNNGGKNRALLEKLRWQILSNPEERWSVEDMAKQVSLSPSRLHAIYKDTFGISPTRDVIQIRIEQAKTLLQMDADMTIPSVSDRLGYHNQYHFIRQFKAITGMTPGAYRKKNQ